MLCLKKSCFQFLIIQRISRICICWNDIWVLYWKKYNIFWTTYILIDRSFLFDISNLFSKQGRQLFKQKRQGGPDILLLRPVSSTCCRLSFGTWNTSTSWYAVDRPHTKVRITGEGWRIDRRVNLELHLQDWALQH